MVSLSVAGLCPLSDKASNMSVSDNTLKVVSSTSRMVKYNFKKLHVFDDYKISGLPLRYPQETPTLRVFDWFNVRSGMEHEHDKLISEDDFVKEVIFYPSVRFGNQESGRIRKDLVAISHIHADDLEDFEVSDTMARFKIIDMMKEVGIRGARNGRDTQNPEVYKYYAVKIESVEREVETPLFTSYEPDDRFVWLSKSPEEILDEFPFPTDTYASKIFQMIQNNT